VGYTAPTGAGYAVEHASQLTGYLFKKENHLMFLEHMQPYGPQEWMLERQQRLARQCQASCARERRARQQLGKALHWLGNRFVVWGQQLQRQSWTPDLEQGS
jgi:hypothetical protein